MNDMLFITDLHIKLSTFTQLTRLEAFLRPWLAENPIGRIVIGGDTLDSHERLCSHALNRACDFIRMLAAHAPVSILVGNHDYVNNSQFLTDRHWLNVLKPWSGVTVVDRPVLVRRVGFVPYVPPGRFGEAAASLPGDADLIFAHQEFYGCRMGAITSQAGDRWVGPPVISGHIHERHHVGSVFYPGASVCHSTAHPSYGPCVVSPTGDVRYIGFESRSDARTVAAPVVDPRQLPGNILTGTETDVSMTVNNPFLRPLVGRRKLLPSDVAGFAGDWEAHVLARIKTRALRDDYEELVRGY